MNILVSCSSHLVTSYVHSSLRPPSSSFCPGNSPKNLFWWISSQQSIKWSWSSPKSFLYIPSLPLLWFTRATLLDLRCIPYSLPTVGHNKSSWITIFLSLPKSLQLIQLCCDILCFAMKLKLFQASWRQNRWGIDFFEYIYIFKFYLEPWMSDCCVL